MISDVRVTLIPQEQQKDKTRAVASVTFDDSYTVHGLRVMEGKNGTFVTMPSRKVGEQYKDIFHPVTADARQELQKRVLAAWERAISRSFETPDR